MQMYRCVMCGELRQHDDVGATFEEIIVCDNAGRFTGATRVMTCGNCSRKKKAEVVDTVEKKPITKDQQRLF